MKNLIYKELFLSIHKFFYILPILLAGLVMIPRWIYLFAFMYFFWLSVPQIFAGYLSQRDYEFTTVLPVKKSDIAKSKGLAIMLIELYHMFFIALVGIVHNLVYGSFNVFIEIGPAFFGYAFVMFAIFNIIFLPLYFRTAYHYGKPLIYASVVATIFGVGLELLALLSSNASKIINNPDSLYQLGMLFAGFIIFIFVNWFVLNRSARNYESIK
jgi:hypothetical protein